VARPHPGRAAFLRRRLTGDYVIDEFGFDEDFASHVMMPLLRPLHRYYWRVGSHGAEHLPDGPGMIVANHAGTLPADALMTRLDIFEQTGRHTRELGADLVFRTPFIGPLGRKTGATLAKGDDADRLLERGELLAVWPEGFKGIGKPYKDRYKLQRFGRGGFVATALRAQVPIIPTAIVGSEEIYPLIFNFKSLARVLGFPYFPIVRRCSPCRSSGRSRCCRCRASGRSSTASRSTRRTTARTRPTTRWRSSTSPTASATAIQQMLYRNLMGRRSVFF
jgi:1-acyl-sn-glycerol-3-phosphate acyltransferase